jgi:hypothetical protein
MGYKTHPITPSKRYVKVRKNSTCSLMEWVHFVLKQNVLKNTLRKILQINLIKFSLSTKTYIPFLTVSNSQQSEYYIVSGF